MRCERRLPYRESLRSDSWLVHRNICPQRYHRQQYHRVERDDVAARHRPVNRRQRPQRQNLPRYQLEQPQTARSPPVSSRRCS